MGERMNRKPEILSILQNDSWAASALGAFITMLAMTIIVLAVSPFLKDDRLVNPPTFIGMTVIFCIAAMLVSVLRVRYVNKVFENGVIVKAQIIKSSAFRTNLRLVVRYAYLSQTHEKKVEQLITAKTKKLMRQTEVDLVIDPENPHHILIWDVYL